MPTLDELKAKWFIDENTDSDLTFRYQETNLSRSSDGNLVTVLGEGAAYMAQWNNLIATAIGRTNPEVYNVNWKIDNVLTIANTPNTGALDVLIAGHNQWVTIYQLTCANKMSIHVNTASSLRLESSGVFAPIDNRFPAAGSNHQKFMVTKYDGTAYALLGSIDINENRFDTPDHNSFGMTHDFGVFVEGPAVSDIEWTFLERWNDTSRGLPNMVSLFTLPTITPTVGSYTSTGTHSIQVLRTYGLQSWGSYSWAKTTGEFSIWASTLNAIKNAEQYIYIEDQTFFTFHWPPCCDQYPKQRAKETDVIYQLGEAIKRGVKVGIMVSNKTTYGLYLNGYEKFQRDYSLRYLENIAQNHPGDFFVGYLHNGTDVIYIHSKIFIVDDEFALIGSANIDQRSLTHDSEIKIGVVDSQNQFVKDLRIRLFNEHLFRSALELDDPLIAFDLFKQDVLVNNHRVRDYDFHSSRMWKKHASIMNSVYSPYAGPPQLR